jgi:aarF domain-containing kinase
MRTHCMTTTPPKNLRAAAVPEGRTRRFLHFGRAVSEMAAGAAAEGIARLARGERPDLSQVGQLMLTPGNAKRLAERMSQMRGAVLKLGQLMSMDGQGGNGVLPPMFAEMLAGLRDQAHVMPAEQLAQVLKREYGAKWKQRFRSFSEQPIAAASIGQVHKAETHDGRVLALKIQYPGVKASIDSDVANLVLLTRIPGFIPKGAPDPTPIFDRIREQLHAETDYRAEARAMATYKTMLGDDPVLVVPEVAQEHSTDHILATEFMRGVAIDKMVYTTQSHRDRACAALCRLAVRELFEMGLVQTDPNFGNYLFDANTGRIALLDFGATQTVLPERAEHIRALARAQRDNDAAGVLQAAISAGFLGANDPPTQTQGVVEMMLMAGEPLRHEGPYDFGASSLFKRGFDQGQAQFFGEGFASTPPPDMLFLQRKFVGTFMLCARLKARVDMGEVFGSQLDGASA